MSSLKKKKILISDNLLDFDSLFVEECAYSYTGAFVWNFHVTFFCCVLCGLHVLTLIPFYLGRNIELSQCSGHRAVVMIFHQTVLFKLTDDKLYYAISPS